MIAPLAGVLHWLESWFAHDMAFRMLAEMRIALYRKLDRLAPAYLVRRRTGDLVAMATHDVELVEYFFAHTVAPLLRGGAGFRRWSSGRWGGSAGRWHWPLLPFSRGRGAEPLPSPGTASTHWALARARRSET